MQTSNQVQNIRPFPTLRNGDKGVMVILLQDYLNYYGNNLALDGIFGSRTENAVKNYQDRNNLQADGIVGSQTWNGLFSGYYPRVSQPILIPGSTGDSVRFLQQRLKNLGYALTVDGIFGQRTEAAVKEIQGVRGIPVHGIVEPKTWNALNR
ncbi:MAG: peptidoglycan-binding protein [Calothrix sp. FI2-JRJ7]|jgi:peptidoglycan hydrolase-like protein with peptidoglycan-binding domain|nr:peptidoglycan-binding protein [Calothrix sp. FI2-JRJ7]